MERAFDLQAGFAPYADGSGFAVSVCLRQDTATSAPELRIECNSSFDAEFWPDIKAGIDRLLKAVP